MRYIRTKNGITTSNIVTHELIEDICCAGYLRTLEKGANVTIGKEWSNFYGRWIDIIDENGIHYSIEPNEVKNATKELPQSDNLEELCDEFVYIKDGVVDQYLTIDFKKKREDEYCSLRNKLTANGISEISKGISKYELENGELKFAIWTDKGLIYVAKMNNRGERELI